MKETLTSGVTGQWRHRVVTENLVNFRRPEMPPVLCSPWLLELMESAAYQAIKPHLDPGEASVGVAFDFQHVAPTPCGDTVVATARVTSVEGKQIKLEFEARDSHELIARGKHVRMVIDVQRFRERLKTKTS